MDKSEIAGWLKCYKLHLKNDTNNLDTYLDDSCMSGYYRGKISAWKTVIYSLENIADGTGKFRGTR